MYQRTLIDLKWEQATMNAMTLVNTLGWKEGVKPKVEYRIGKLYPPVNIREISWTI